MSMWDDFRVFDLRREDWVYEKPEQRWGEITQRYRFVSFSGKKLPCRMFDLLNDLYRNQAMSDDKEFLKVRTHFAHDKNIDSDRISHELKKMLISAIADKEQAQAYLSSHYNRVAKKHGQPEILTFAFHLPDNWHPEDEVQINSKFEDAKRLILELDELKRRFTTLKKKITSDRLYTAASGYSRLIVLSQKFEPFYVVNFFFKKNKQSRIDGNIPLDIYDKWIESGEKKYRRNEKVKYFRLRNAARPDLRNNDRLFIFSPEDITGNIHIDNLIETIISDDISIKNVRKEHINFFRIQAQIYNSIPRVRTLTSSDDFTYLNAEVRKKRKVTKRVRSTQSPSKYKKPIRSGDSTTGDIMNSDTWTLPATYPDDAL
ncbi:hypothetical protein [Yersinia pseudotuberculosis]|uniref:hypothetical protein n=1 Tax=Yersinia pseudotuberculosis TaxID=633 RepID=UPI0005AD427F|nr:hypothetical protein [Yersinia pseudotuberculosis]AJJ07428.1 hypothetical protein BZ20_994 [Yersinia pseudotuberculosis]MBO1588164.1 hypothetical protein [Yersinia pseudotuberculosis]VEE72966.1 Uncharacterised protein [Yersinia pseudotuberculosis]